MASCNTLSSLRRTAAPWPLILALIPLILLAAGCDRPAPQTRPKGEPGRKDTTGGITLRDAIGEEVRLERPAVRVVTLAPSLTEMVFAIGGGENLVGRSTYCNFPPEALKVEPVGDMLTLNYEKIVSLKPDLVLMTYAGNIEKNYWKLRDLGITVCAVRDETVDGAIEAIDTVGRLMGRTAEAGGVTDGIRRMIDSIATLESGKKRVRTFIVIDKAPLMTVSTGFLAEEIELAGGENIAKGGLTAYPRYSREELLRNDPDVIIVPGESQDAVEELLELYPEWKGLAAARNNRIYVISPDAILRPGPRIGKSMGLLHRALHGEDPKVLLQESLSLGLSQDGKGMGIGTPKSGE